MIAPACAVSATRPSRWREPPPQAIVAPIVRSTAMVSAGVLLAACAASVPRGHQTARVVTEPAVALTAPARSAAPEARTDAEFPPACWTAHDREQALLAGDLGRAPKERFEAARAAYGSQAYALAALLFQSVAEEPQDPLLPAVMLYLDSINLIAQRSNEKKGCMRFVVTEVDRLFDVHCANDAPEGCEALLNIQCDARRWTAEHLVALADSDPSAAIVRYRQAGDGYMALWKLKLRRHGARALGCSRGDEILYNAAMAYQAGNAIHEADEAKRVLLDPASGFKSSPLVKYISTKCCAGR